MRPLLRPLAVCAALSLAAAGAAAAASPLSLAVSHSARLRLAGPAGSVVVGSPSVVDVSVVDSRTVFVSGRTPGSTDVTVVDPLGRVVYSGEIVVGAGERTVSIYRGVTRSDTSFTPDGAVAGPDAGASARTGAAFLLGAAAAGAANAGASAAGATGPSGPPPPSTSPQPR